MNKKLKRYFEIELAGFPKQKRNQFHTEFLHNLTIEELTFEDISILLNESERKTIAIRQPFFEQIIYPIIAKEISRNNLRAFKHLIKLEQNLLKFQIRAKNYEPTKRQLIIKGLEINPDDKELLEIYETDLRNYLQHTIHEIPLGVLYGMDGANASECNELLELLNQYEKICKRLSLNRTDLIEECAFHFRNYTIYLQRANEFKNYEDFLRKEQTNFPNSQKRL